MNLLNYDPSPHFLCDESRCDYLVSAKMKRIWCVLMDLYLEFSKICDRHGLKYWGIWGTLLGAVRHNGFVPWDDDMDVCMPREDYEEFCRIAPEEMSYPYFLSTPWTDKGCYYSIAKLRNSETSGFSKMLIYSGFNGGLMLDIFPLDSCDPTSFYSEREVVYEHLMRLGSYMKSFNPCLDDIQKAKVAKYHTDNPFVELQELTKIATNDKYKNSEWCATVVNTSYPASKHLWPKRCFEGCIIHKFEDIDIRIPSGYDELLRIIYGDYNKFPPIEKRGTWHSDSVFDPDIPYGEMLEILRKEDKVNSH